MVSYQKLNSKHYQSANSKQPKVRRKGLLCYLTENQLGSTAISQFFWPRLLARKKRKNCGYLPFESMESDTHLFACSKILLYISSMLAFYQAFHQAFNATFEKDKLYERLGSVPSMVVDSLLSRFAEMARGSTRYFQCYADIQRIIYLLMCKVINRHPRREQVFSLTCSHYVSGWTIMLQTLSSLPTT